MINYKGMLQKICQTVVFAIKTYFKVRKMFKKLSLWQNNLIP